VHTCATKKQEYICTRFSKNKQRSFDKQESECDAEVKKLFSKINLTLRKRKYYICAPLFKNDLKNEVLIN